MIKTIFQFSIASIILCLTTSQTIEPNKPSILPKQFTVTLSLDQWNYVLDAIDKSNAGHLQVKQIQELIVPQLQKQLADTTSKKK